MGLRVLISATSYPPTEGDWRGISIKKICDALAKNADLELNFCGPQGPMSSNIRYLCSEGERRWLNKIMEQGGFAHIMRTSPLSAIPPVLRLMSLLKKHYYHNRERIDIYHINWLQNALPLLSVPRKPALITVLGADFGLLKVPGMIFAVRRVIRSRDCIIAPNAEWMEDKLMSYFGDIAEVVTAPLGLDDLWYRVKRNVDYNKRIWIVVLRVTKKKIGKLFEWGRRYFSTSGELHIFGPNQEGLSIPRWAHYHGHVTHEELARDWYPQAYGMISLSSHDEGRPQSLMEALAGGLPVIVSDIKAHSDIVINGQTGWIVKNSDDFERALAFFEDKQKLEMFSHNAREYARSHFGTWDDCAQRYIKLYKRLCAQA